MSGLASLPMYDLVEVRNAHAALWAGIARHLRCRGVTGVPEALSFERPAGEVWSDPALVFSQCCGADLVGAFAGTLLPVATPCYRAPGCTGARYASIVVVAEDAPVRAIEDLRGKVAAINGPHSHSGASALRALIAPTSRGGRFFARVVPSGAHVQSLAMVARGEADVAAIDGVVHALLARHRPQALGGTRPLCRTATAPAPPYVTRADASPNLIDRLRAALNAAFVDPELAAAREDLLLSGIEILPASAYDEIREFECLAARHGYSRIA